ncbi:hypothetical protein [Lichenifustis flavocetrariae]|uniref:Uncharacterized protein n=1 Tax=Lichenifustis flavocetrariae TaxID=2949735 RepID=A0AA41YX48_9HYPH|nr:hypothetical protein [Lichenifustis flavocetrariae]MCW6508782.1 hypothetical protein [Lichenifustis flavocetrariae]
MTAALFLAYLLLVAGAVLVGSFRLLPRPTMWRILAGLLAWLAYVGVLGLSGVLRNPALKPPGSAFVLLPVVLFLVLVVIRSAAAGRIARAVPLPLLIAAEAFRIGVELFFHQLWIDGLVPKMLTFEGANVDIFIGLSAPLAAWASTRGSKGHRVAFVWNILGLLALANVATRAVLSAPGPLNVIHAEVPNLSIGTFPFVYIAGFFAPLAVTLHILAIRALMSATHTMRNADRDVRSSDSLQSRETA